MNISTPSFIPALVALPFIAATFILALRAPRPRQERPLPIIAALAAGLLLLVASYPLFNGLGAWAALLALVGGCLSLHLAMWLGRAESAVIEEAAVPAPLDPDLLNFDDIDWGGFDEARDNWANSKTTLPLV